MKKKLLILQNNILHYRIPLYNLLSENYSVYVLHSGNKVTDKTIKFNEIVVKNYKILGLNFQSKVFRNVFSGEYDYVITMFDFHFPKNLLLMILTPQKTNFIWWGQWITGNTIADKMRITLSDGAHRSILYTESAKRDFLKRGVKAKNLFVANNTIDIPNRIRSYNNKEKSIFLFVGSLNKRKRLDILIEAYNEIVNKLQSNFYLVIVGDGEEKERLKKMTVGYGLKEKIFFEGKINEPKDLMKFYKKAIVSISFGQAGLSVLQSMGNGVPFLTSKNAISGGEITNIKHLKNGILCDNTLGSLASNLLFLAQNIDKAREMGKNAFEFYSEYCTIQNMADSFIKAIEDQ